MLHGECNVKWHLVVMDYGETEYAPGNAEAADRQAKFVARRDCVLAVEPSLL